MKLLKTAFWGLVFSLISLIPAYSYSAALGDLRVSYLDGDVQVRTADTSDWVPASINMPLIDGDAIWVPGGSRAGIQLRDGTHVRLDEGSSLEILTIGGDSFQFYLSLGQAYVNFAGRQGTLLQMDTPVSSTRAYNRARFRIDVADNGFTDVSVFSGSVTTEGGGGKTRVTAGKILSLGGDTYAELAPLGPADDWERWNREMDRKLERRYSARYLPGELDPYSYEFDEYGKWVSTREYGYVWTPTVVVGVDWAPYRLGRWTWIGGDYVWVSYDPWGWAPYHYGRWAFVGSFGWCWVPPVRGAVYWSPGFVAWVSTPTYVSWIPLAPGEIYYGHGYFGPHSVNITNININTINITHVYKNVNVTNAVTVVHRDTFVSGRHVDVSVRENPFLTQRVSVGRPDIAPTRTSRIPVVKSIPASKEPPQPIRQIQASKLKESRPVVKNPDRSVLRPGAALKPMEVTTLKEPRRPGTAVQPERLRVPERPAVPTEREIKRAPERPAAPTEREIKRAPERPAAPAEREIKRAPERPAAPAEREIKRAPERPAAPAEREIKRAPARPAAPADEREIKRAPARPAAPAEREIKRAPARPAAPAEREIKRAPARPAAPAEREIKRAPARPAAPADEREIKRAPARPAAPADEREIKRAPARPAAPAGREIERVPKETEKKAVPKGKEKETDTDTDTEKEQPQEQPIRSR